MVAPVLEEYKDINAEDIIDSSTLSIDERKQLLAITIAAYRQERQFNKAKYFVPNEAQLEFFSLGKSFSERLASWANRLGKTWGFGFELYCHMRGEYPEWWNGRRYSTPISVLVLGFTHKAIRGSSQRILLDEGNSSQLGSGVIPKNILDQGEITWVKDENNCVDTLRIPHINGGFSSLQFVTQSTNWENLMGNEWHICWADEQLYTNPDRFYGQFLRGTASNRDSLIVLTATPEKGRGPYVWDRFEKEDRPNCIIHYGNLHQATQYSKEQIEEIIASYPERELPYRVWGKPVTGSGMVYNIDEKKIKIPPFKIPRHYKRICGIDFGRARSYTALSFLAIDPDTGIYYLYDSFRMRGADPNQISPFILQRYREAGFDIPCSFPKDGNNMEASTGNRVAKIYAQLGIRMLEEAAYLLGQDGKKTYSVAAGCMEIEFLMNAGRFFIFDVPNNDDHFQELRIYMKDENGLIPKTESNDPHSLDSMRYAFVMSEKFAIKPPNPYNQVPKTIKLKSRIFSKN